MFKPQRTDYDSLTSYTNLHTCEFVSNYDMLNEPSRIRPDVVVSEAEAGDHAKVAAPEGEVDHSAGDLGKT